MIRITKGPEPDDLRDARNLALPKARVAYQSGAPIAFDGYQKAKPTLSEVQGGKCCYCEYREQSAEYKDVEHYRPKSEYWWLAWTWENLYFACEPCNRKWKKDQFPLRPGSQALVPEQNPPGQEHPLILDPGSRTTNPVEEIQFCRERVAGKERWVPRPRNGSELGRVTIKLVGLDRPGLLDHYARHVNDMVRPRVDEVCRAAKAGGQKEVFGIWNGRIVRGLLSNPQAAFRALSYDALHVLTPWRDDYHLEIEMPG